MIQVLLYILYTLAVLLGIILLAPIHFDFGGEYAQSLSFQGRMRWAGGLLGLEIDHREGKFNGALGIFGLKKTISIRSGKTANSEKTSKSQKTHSPKKDNDSGSNISSFFNLQLFTAVNNVFHQLVRALHLRLNLSGTFGFDDPSLTGVTLGLISTFDRGSGSLDLTPDFTRAVVDMRGSFKGWMIPLQILVIGIVFLLMKPVRAIWWPKIKFRKKQKGAAQYA